MSEGVSRPFGKYERFGAYHWREIEALPTHHNAVLTARYRVLLDAMDANAKRVLDIGCGDGTLTFRLAGRSERVWGITRARRVCPPAAPPRACRDECRCAPSAVCR